MKRDEYQRVLGAAHAVRMMARTVADGGLLDEAIDLIARADAVGSVLDPTLYRERQELMAQDEATLRTVRVLASLGNDLAGAAAAHHEPRPEVESQPAGSSPDSSSAPAPAEPFAFTDGAGRLRMRPAAS